MKRKLKGCQMGCDLPCIREGCPYWGGVELICDECGDEAETLYNLNGRELCEDCLRNLTLRLYDVCEECGKHQSELVNWKQRHICIDCFCKDVLHGNTIPVHHFWCDECNEWVSELYFDESGASMCFDCLKKSKEVKE